MGINDNNLKPCVRGLISFIRLATPIVGIITLPLILGEWRTMAIEMIDFLVIDMPYAYNGKIGRTSQAGFRAITSTK